METSLIHISLSEWLLIASQVFGGCCSNVFVLENIISNNQSQYSLGTTITFSQFLCVALLSYYPNRDFKNSSWKRMYLKNNKVPLMSWVWMVIMFFSVSLLNNLVWKFNISVPIHIIFRSSGTVVTMLVGYFFGNKSYSFGQICSSIIISAGTIKATLPAGSGNGGKFESMDHKLAIGMTMLVIASIVSAFMGLYNEQLYKRYGNQWTEGLFYSHFLALPLFLIVSPNLINELKVIWNHPNRIGLSNGVSVSKQFLSLLLNVLSQYLCIKGVHMLAAKTTALTVTVVLLVRKFISLFISVIWFGNELTRDAMIGAFAVFFGALQYSMSTTKRTVPKPPRKID